MGNTWCDGKGKETAKYEGSIPEGLEIKDFVKYKWIRHIAEGSNSQIAEYEKEGQRTIVKIIHFHDKEEHEYARKLAYYMSMLEYFRTTTLKGYFFKFKMNTANECNGYLALNMDQVESVLSGVIANRILNDKPFRREEIDNIMRECLDGLKYIHGIGITHRAIKPSKFLVRGSNVKDSSHMDWAASPPTLKLCGLYHDVPRAYSKNDLAYLAPELRNGGNGGHDDDDDNGGAKPAAAGGKEGNSNGGNEVDYRAADIYSLGVVFLACLALQDLRGHVLDQDKIEELLTTRAKDCPEEVEIIRIMLSKNPADRGTAESIHERVLKLYWKKGGASAEGGDQSRARTPVLSRQDSEGEEDNKPKAPSTAGRTPGAPTPAPAPGPGNRGAGGRTVTPPPSAGLGARPGPINTGPTPGGAPSKPSVRPMERDDD
jgi:serine/threonine protein kinase